MKKKAVTKIARGQMAKALVLRGLQGKDRQRPDSKGPVPEQVRQGCEQEKICHCQEVAMEPGCRKGAQGVEDYGLLCNQEGHSSVHKGKGVLQCVSVALMQM